MKKKIIIFLLLVIFCPGLSLAEISTDDLAVRSREGSGIFAAETAQRDARLAEIMGDPTLSPSKKQKAVRRLQDEFMKTSREIHLKYREPFIRRVIDEVNGGLPEEGKIKQGLGSDIYLRHEVTGKVLRDEKGRKIINPRHRGMKGDLDIAGDPKATKRLEEAFKKYGISWSEKYTDIPDDWEFKKDAPGSRDFKPVEVTINVEGGYDPPGSSAHQTRVQMDAFSKETYVSVSMGKKQAGKSLVETNDHIKKAAKGLSSPPLKLLGAEGEDILQGMSKGTLKSIESGRVSNAQLKKILEKSGFKGGVNEFKYKMNKLKLGHLYQGVGLDEGNIETFQKACRGVTEQAVENARELTSMQMKNTQKRIEKYEEKIKSGGLPEEDVEKYRKRVNTLRNELADSKVKIEQTELANRVKLEGGDYDSYFKKSELKIVSPDVKADARAPIGPGAGAAPKKPGMTRMTAIKEGLRPGMLDVAGYGMSAYNIYDNIKRMQKGEITQNDAVIGITTEAVDTGLGVVTDVGTAAAVGSIGTGTTGAVATVAAPLVVTAAAGYAVSQAVEEGLRTYEAFKIEEIAEIIAKSKKEEVFNRLQLQAEQLLKDGEKTGDWRYFAKADDIADSLEHMYRVTGDLDYREVFNSVYDKVTQKKEALEEKYNTSIYGIKTRMAEEAAKEQAPAKTQAAAPAQASQVTGPDEIGLGPVVATLKDFDGQPLEGSAGVGDRLAFEVERIGKWDRNQDIEWLVNGTPYKKKSASNPNSHRFSMVFSDIYDPGLYEVAVRVLDKKTGRIIAHEKTGFRLKPMAGAQEQDEEADTATRDGRPDASPPLGNQDAGGPEIPVSTAGISPANPPPPEDLKSRCMPILNEIVQKKKNQVQASKQMKEIDKALVQRFKQRLAALNARVDAANSQIRSGNKTAALETEIQWIKSEQAVLQAFEKAHNEFWQKPCNEYIPVVAQTLFARQEGYDSSRAMELCSTVFDNEISDQEIQARLAQAGCVDEKGNFLFDPATEDTDTSPDTSTGSSGQYYGEVPESDIRDILDTLCECYKRGYTWQLDHPDEYYGNYMGNKKDNPKGFQSCDQRTVFGTMVHDELDRPLFGGAFTQGAHNAWTDLDAIKQGEMKSKANDCGYTSWYSLSSTVQQQIEKAWKKASGQ